MNPNTLTAIAVALLALGSLATSRRVTALTDRVNQLTTRVNQLTTLTYDLAAQLESRKP